MIESLDVMIWGKKAGTLVASRNGYKSRICFYFDRGFINEGIDLAPLRAPITGNAAKSGLPVYPEEDKAFEGLPSFISDSLPDHWGNVIFNEWAKANKIRQKDLTALDRLAYIGRRGMGALEFVPPAAGRMEAPFRVEIAQLSQLAQMALNEAKGFHISLKSDLTIESLFKVGTSAGGRRPKAVINVNLDTGECYSGQVLPSNPDFTPMIIKFDEHGEVPTTRIEYSYYLMGIAAGLNIMPSRLVQNGEEVHFLTERFDRRDGDKVHVQTLAALCPTADSYEELFRTAQRIGILPLETQRLYLQMIMNILCANVDDHNKNFSFIMGKDRVWHVSPTYDFTFTIDPSAPFYLNRHSMTVNGNNQEITMEDVLEVGRRFNIKATDAIIKQARNVVANYRQYAVEAGVPETWITKIESQIADRLEYMA